MQEHDDLRVRGLQQYVTAAAKQLGVTHKVTVSHQFPEQDEPGSHIEESVTPNGRQAELRVCSRFFSMTEEQRRRLIAHELTHVLLFGFSDCAETQIERAVVNHTKRQKSLDLLARAEERAVRKLEPLIAAQLPFMPDYTNFKFLRRR